MATRYSKRQIDGSVEYYNSRDEMEAANPSASYGEILKIISSSFNPFLAFAGFVITGVAALWFASHIGESPTWVRFIAVLCVALIGGFLSGKFGNALLLLAVLLIGAGIAYSLGYAVWHLL